jgi:predicted metalloprotease with PDZ domain
MMRSFRAAAALALLLLPAALRAQDRAISLEVDAREAPLKIFHAKLVFPASPGPMALLYPKWIPGEHGPTGPVTDLAGLRLTAGGRAIPWTRDPTDMFRISCEVPVGADSLEVRLDYLSAASASGFSSGSSATARLAVVSWNQVLLYPAGPDSDRITYAPSIRLPAGWKFATALETERTEGERTTFRPVSLTTLVDSPLLAGSHLRTQTLSEGPIAHRLNLAADGEPALQIPAFQLDAYRRLAEETGALFGARHYRHYDFLVTLSDAVSHFGLEHHESSDDRVAERWLIDEDKRLAGGADLLAHEMVHSWNGKYRRPAGLAPGRFDQPMRGDLLWVYEGLTQYLGAVLAARSGLMTLDQARQNVAVTAAEMEATRGRSWRSLADTAVAAQLLYDARGDWSAWRRGVDFYPEGLLLWLEADALIRRESRGAKSLDDFCRLFYGPPGGPPAVVPYTFADVTAALDRVQPHDWNAFWKERLESTALHAPLAGVQASGWRLTYGTSPSELLRARESANKTTDERFSIGLLADDDGRVPDVIPDSAAAKAGIGPGVRIVAVNGRRYTREVFRDAVAASPTRAIELLVANGDFFSSHRLDYTGGLRFPQLERDTGAPDLLTKILEPRAGRR